MNKYIEKPDIELHDGIVVREETKIEYESDQVSQVITRLKLESIINSKGNNGDNNWDSKTYLSIKLNDGQVLLFEEGRGYYLPTIPMIRIEEGIEDLTSLRGLDK